MKEIKFYISSKFCQYKPFAGKKDKKTIIIHMLLRSSRAYKCLNFLAMLVLTLTVILTDIKSYRKY